MLGDSLAGMDGLQGQGRAEVVSSGSCWGQAGHTGCAGHAGEGAGLEEHLVKEEES